jgi:hypothetical protein
MGFAMIDVSSMVGILAIHKKEKWGKEY